MTAADRLAALENLDAQTLCTRAETALAALVEVMNRETTYLRAGHMREATALTGEKTQHAQDYVAIARAVQRVSPRDLIAILQAIKASGALQAEIEVI